MSANPEALYEVVRYVRPLHLLAARAVSDALAGERITMGVRAVLECLADRGPLPVPGIGRALSLPRQVVQRLCDQALEQGLVTTAPNPAHRRSPLVTLTDTGRAAFTRIHAVELGNLARIAAGLRAEDVAAATRVLDALATELPQFTRTGGPDSLQEEFA